MNSNTPLEADVASIRTDLSYFRDEFRAVIARIDHDIRTLAARAETGLQSALARIDEQFREIRQDIRELRADYKSLRDKGEAADVSLNEKIDAHHASLNAKIDANHASLNARIDNGLASLNDKIDDGLASVNAKIDANHASANARIDNGLASLSSKIDDMRTDITEMRGSIADLRAMQKAILWLLGGLVTLATLSVTAAKAFHWV